MVDAFRFLLRMDDHAALVMLFWGNISLCVLVFAYVSFAGAANGGFNGSFLRKFALARGTQAVAWVLILMYKGSRDQYLLVSGCIFAVAGLFGEADALLSVTSMATRSKKRLRGLSAGLLTVGFLLFAVSRVVAGNGISVTVALVSLSVMLAACSLGPLTLARPGTSMIRKLVGLSALAMYLSAVGWTLGGSAPFPLRAFQGSLAQDAFRIALVILTLSGGTGVLILAKEEADRKIADLAIRDPLTELYNRRYFLERGLQEFADCARNGEEAAFIFLDLDGFKKINDRWGHQFGDAVLRDFSALMRLGLRPLDLCCRYGGEEFVVFLPRTGREGAAVVAERILEAVRSSKFPDRLDFSYTASAGIAYGVPDRSDEETFLGMIAKSDSALYQAKRAGKNRVAFWDREAEPAR